MKKLFGGLKMSWLTVILFAIATAVYTAAMLILVRPFDLSFSDIGATWECWVFFAIIIMTNCQKPWESALKTFVFFLISQPLIYLLQVPFNDYGWGIFAYYPPWFNWTLMTLPMAFVGWYIKKKNWLSILILSSMFFLLSSHGCSFIWSAFKNPPHHLLSGLFCFAQIILYSLVLFDKKKYKILSLAVAAVICVAVILGEAFFPSSNNPTTAIAELPENISVSATAELEDENFGTVELDINGDYHWARIYTSATNTSTILTVKDGDKTYRYQIKIGEEDGIRSCQVIPME